jgi:hypothetical protein
VICFSPYAYIQMRHLQKRDQGAWRWDYCGTRLAPPFTLQSMRQADHCVSQKAGDVGTASVSIQIPASLDKLARFGSQPVEEQLGSVGMKFTLATGRTDDHW